MEQNLITYRGGRYPGTIRCSHLLDLTRVIFATDLTYLGKRSYDGTGTFMQANDMTYILLSWSGSTSPSTIRSQVKTWFPKSRRSRQENRDANSLSPT